MWIKKSEYDELVHCISKLVNHYEKKEYFIMPEHSNDCRIFYYLNEWLYKTEGFHGWEIDGHCRTLDANGWKQIDKPIF